MPELRGKRALVTGASSGIGAAMARQLAEQGVDLVLTARRKAALDEVAEACTKHGVRVDVITADLGIAGSAATVWSVASANGPIDICINNAGFGYFKPFVEVEASRDLELLQLNVTSLVELSRMFVESRKSNPGRAYLLNVSSIAAFQSVPYFAVYAASKVFVRNFTEALAAECKGTPVSATCLCPGGTATEFHAQAGAGNYGWIANASMMSAEKCARIGLRAMVRGKRTIISGLINKLSCFGVRLVPRRFASWMSTVLVGKPRPAALPARTTTGKAA